MTSTNTRKITAELPAAEIEKAMRYTGEGLTKTLSQTLEEFNRKHALAEFAEARGKFSFPDFDINELREDRD